MPARRSARASELERPSGDAEPSATALGSAAGALGDVLDWLGRADLHGLETFQRLPADEPEDNNVPPRSDSARMGLAQTQPSSSQNSSVSPGKGASSPGIAPSPPVRDRSKPGQDSSALCAAGCLGAAEEASTLEDEEENEWLQRQQRTGTVGRLVRYNGQERPKDDLLLRGGEGRHVSVAAVRNGGPASMSGVKVGDRLVSIDGKKDLLKKSAQTISDALYGPTVLVFVGFVGKLQAEVRLGCTDKICGLKTQQAVLRNSGESSFTLCEERVFNAGVASLFLNVGAPRPAGGSAIDDNDRSPLLELQRMEASTILRRALEGPGSGSDSTGRPVFDTDEGLEDISHDGILQSAIPAPLPRTVGMSGYSASLLGPLPGADGRGLPTGVIASSALRGPHQEAVGSADAQQPLQLGPRMDPRAGDMDAVRCDADGEEDTVTDP